MTLLRSLEFAVTLFVFSLCGISLPMRSQQSAIGMPATVTLASLRDRYRPLLVFAPSDTPQLIEQARILTKGTQDLRERDVITLPLLLQDDTKSGGVTFSLSDTGRVTPYEQASIRRRFHVQPNNFTVILIGKDGGEKLRSHQLISLETLRSTIDAMPMRQDEMRANPKP